MLEHRGYSRYTKYLLTVIDLIILNLSLLLIIESGFFEVDRSNFNASIFGYNLLWILIVSVIRPYRENRLFNFFNETGKIVPVFTVHFIIVLIISTLNDAVYPQFFYFLYIIIFSGLLASRIALVNAFIIYRKKGYNYRNIVVYGSGKLAEQLRTEFDRHPELGFRHFGVFDEEKHENVIGTKKDLKSFALNNNIDEIYCCLPDIDYKDLREIVDFGDDNFIKVKLISDLRSTSKKGFSVEVLNNLTFLNLSSIPLDNIDNRVIKRAFDIIFSLFVIIFILSWMFPIIALFIKIDSKGPVLFKQNRTGQKNKIFLCLKFRTMRENPEAHKKQAEEEDHRITKVGNFLRKSSLDELPQFVNVLIGDMSVVGPRPHMVSHTHEYSKLISKYMSRHNVKPGITGLAQVKGFRGRTKELHKMESRIDLDKTYIESWSMLLDMKIVFMTISHILFSKN